MPIGQGQAKVKVAYFSRKVMTESASEKLENRPYRLQIALDTETTGLDVENGDRLIEIGCVRIESRTMSDGEGSRFHRFVNPEREIPEDAIAVHHITNEMVADKPVFAEVVDDFLAFIKDAELLIHNAEFDVGVLNMELARLGRGKLEDYCAKITDTIPLARHYFPGRSVNLTNLCYILEIDTTEREREGHGALLDAELLAEVYLGMTRGQSKIKLTAATDHPELFGEIPPPEACVVLKATADELVEHEAMLDRVEKAAKAPALWRKLNAPETPDEKAESEG